MVSDGVYDGLNSGSDDKIKSTLIACKEKTEREIAEELLNKAQQSGNDDDMTVMVVRVVA